MTQVFTGSFTQQLPIPEAGIAAAVEVMRSGCLHRYEQTAGQTAALEREFADAMGAEYCLATASGGAALRIALRALGVEPGDPVLSNAFTLAPVPGAIAALGARPILVDITPELTIDLDDLAEKLPQAKVLLLSHMRGHICDMDRLMALCDAADVAVVEDCAHTMGARWNGTWSGRHGHIGCYSTQTYKHLNSGEGGLLVTDDAEAMARAVLLSGSYMFYDRHEAAPDPDAFTGSAKSTPNVSARMDELRAAILRPQLAALATQCAAWTARYRIIEDALRCAPGLQIIPRPAAEDFVGSSIQFLAPQWDAGAVQAYLAACHARGVVLKWFGADEPHGYTSRYDHWTYISGTSLPATDSVLSHLLDMRISLTFSPDDCQLIGRVLSEEAATISAGTRAAE